MTWKNERQRHQLASKGISTKQILAKGSLEPTCIECGSDDLTIRDDGYYCYDCGHSVGTEPWSSEKRTFTVDKDGEIRDYKAIVGTVWMSGYDERLYDDIEGLEPGKYIVTFKGSEDGGSDAIKDVDIKKVG